MKFIVTRTSSYGEASPCEEAYESTVLRVDERTTDDPAKIPMGRGSNGQWWYEDGANHRVENGHIMRDMGDMTVWCIDIDSLEELITFQSKYGEIIITESWRSKEFLTIEIYDDYRE